MTSFGTELRQKRIDHGVSLEEISTSTRIATRYLTALENDEFGKLPGGVFNKGIVRSYARCVGMDELSALGLYSEACQTLGIPSEQQNWQEFANNVSAQRRLGNARRMRWIGAIAIVLAVVALGTLTAYMLAQRGVITLPHWLNKALPAPVSAGSNQP